MRHKKHGEVMDAMNRIDGKSTLTDIRDLMSDFLDADNDVLESTQQRYRRVVAQLEKSANGKTMDAVIDHLKKLVSEQRITRSTLRLYRSALIHEVMSTAVNNEHNDSILNKCQHDINALRAIKETPLKNSSENTSSQKARYFDKEFYKEFSQATVDGAVRQRHAGTLVAFLNANLLVGLRPIEWFSAEVISVGKKKEEGADGFFYLRIANAKNTNGRANGPYREIELRNIDVDSLAYIFYFIEITSSYRMKQQDPDNIEAVAQGFYKPLQQLLRRQSAAWRKKTGKEGVMTLYSTRHQVVADAKASGMSPVEIAAFFGHNSVHTAKRHYGTKYKGSTGMKFAPSKESISAVRTHNVVGQAPLPPSRVMSETRAIYEQTIEGKDPE